MPFTEDVSVSQSDLLVKGVSVAGYAVTGFAYNPADFTAKWTLGQTRQPGVRPLPGVRLPAPAPATSPTPGPLQ